ncbi:MAG: hypothetical protein R2710_29460 [Acidimicrobiales bacterium]
MPAEPRGIGKQGRGSLAHLHPQHVAATVLKALADRNNLDTSEVDDIVWGTSAQVAEQGGDIGRMAALDAGYDTKASGVTLDRFCGSGITSVNFAAGMVMSGMEDLVIAGGTELMSLPKTGALGLGANNQHLRDIHPQPHQGVAADAIATLEKISREALDAHAAESQARAAKAIAEGRFDKSVVPVYNLDGSLALDHEEFHARAPRSRSWPSCSRSSVPLPTTRWARTASPSVSSSPRSSPTSRSNTFITPGTRRAWSTVPLPSCWPAPTTQPSTASRPGAASLPWPTWATIPPSC